MAAERLSPLDASFLGLESAPVHMTIASLVVAEDGPVDFLEATEVLESRLHLVPRFRQRLATVPFGQGFPLWVDDERFDLRRHVHHVGLPPGGSEAQLLDLTGSLLSQQLDRSRPLWEMWYIDGLPRSRFAILTKVHHCMWDGITGADVHTLLMDVTPEVPRPVPRSWDPAPGSGPLARLVQGVGEQARAGLSLAGGVLRSVSNPRHAARDALQTVGDATLLLRTALRPAPRSPLNARISPERRLDVVRGSLDALKAVRTNLGGTVNDAVLTTVAGALRYWLRFRGLRRIHSLKAMVPVSVRTDEQRGAFGNRVALMVVPVPVDEDDPVQRHETVRGATSGAKLSRQAAATERLTGLAAYAPPLMPLALRLGAAQRTFNLLVTNIPGPQFPLYSAGHRVTDIFPVAPLAANTSVNVAVMSYDGGLGFGVLSDPVTLPDAWVIADGLERSLEEIAGAAGVTSLARARQPEPAGVR